MPTIAALAAVSGFLSVAFGAFGAHALGEQLSAEARGWWETATLYGLAHSVAALALSRRNVDGGDSLAARAAAAFVLGALFFSGSLYTMALVSIGGETPRALGLVTPVGGLLFLIGWALAGAGALRQKT